MNDAAITTYVIAESTEGGEYWAGHRWTPAENEAAEYELWGDAEAIIAEGLGDDQRPRGRLSRSRWRDHQGGAMTTTITRRSRVSRTPQSIQVLAPREKVVAGLVCEGLSNPEIAAAMTVTRKSIENYLRAIYAHYGLTDGADGSDGAKRVKLFIRIHEDRQLCNLFGEDY